MIDALFVYGTLRPGQRRWRHLAPFVVGDGADETVAGELYDTGHGYPAARFDRPGSVHGRRYSLDVDRIDECLEILDEVEAVVTDLFRRVAVRTSSGVDAWAYEYCGKSEFPVIASGDWLTRIG